MDRNTRSFIVASLAYLSVGAVLGVLMVWAPDRFGGMLFTHVHLLLGGFMAMMVFGVGYFILPRFAGAGLRWPSLVAVHFWLANTSLVGMVVARPAAMAGSDAWRTIFLAAATIQAVAAFLFVVNLGWTLLAPAPRPTGAVRSAPAPRPVQPPAHPTRLPAAGTLESPGPDLGPSSPVGTWVDGKEGALELLVQAGLTPLRDPGHLEMVRRAGIPLAHACERHGIPLAELVGRLRALPDRTGAGGLTPDLVIGDVVRRHPATRGVLKELFGEGCFSCPGFETESLAQGALMHGVAVDELIARLNEAMDED